MNFIDLEAEDSDIEHAYNIDESGTDDELQILRGEIPSADRDVPLENLCESQGMETAVIRRADVVEDEGGSEGDEKEDECAGFARGIRDGDGFRLSSVWVLITWSQPTEFVWKPDLEEIQRFCEGKGATAGIISRELHRNGKYHVHALLERRPKWCVRNCRFFDIGLPDGSTVHPNFRSVLKGQWERAEEYVCKDGDTLKWNVRSIPATSKNYIRRQADRRAWEQDIQRLRKKPVPDFIRGFDGERIKLNDSSRKKCHYLIHGPASVGKSSWLYHELRGCRYYIPAAGPNAFDDYENESVIAWTDPDALPQKSILCFFSDLGIKYAPAQTLKARYYNKLCNPGQRTMFILCNSEQYLSEASYTQKWFIDRFNVIDTQDVYDVDESWECQDSDCDCE